MPSGRNGSIHLFRLAGVDLYLHWSWFLVAIYEIQGAQGRYSSVVWNVLEYLALFLIVLLHEFGHAMACRQVGGTADTIVLWPVLYVAIAMSRSLGWAHSMHDVYALVRAVFWIDVSLLVFNLLPIYPLDGGQILRSLLWFVLGRGRSLMVATVLGLLGAAGLVALAVAGRDLRLHGDE